MVDVVLTKQRIEPGKISQLREWTEEIRQRENEAVATLKNEGMHSESAFIESTADGDFLVYYMEAEASMKCIRRSRTQNTKSTENTQKYCGMFSKTDRTISSSNFSIIW
jgi:hypothetical protein